LIKGFESASISVVEQVTVDQPVDRGRRHRHAANRTGQAVGALMEKVIAWAYSWY
jgi:hypothetical protein